MMKFQRIIFSCLFGLLVIGNANAQSARQTKQQVVRIETVYGNIVVSLYNSTPGHRDNFIRLAKARYFDTLSFNRIIKNFVVQGGDPDSIYRHREMLNKDQHWIKAELHDSLYHKKGALGMGRDENAKKSSFSTQFYVVTGRIWTDEELDAVEKKLVNGRKLSEAQRAFYKATGGLPYLDGNYTVFGEVQSGMDVLEQLSNLPGDKEGTPHEKVPMKVRVSVK